MLEMAQVRTPSHVYTAEEAAQWLRLQELKQRHTQIGQTLQEDNKVWRPMSSCLQPVLLHHMPTVHTECFAALLSHTCTGAGDDDGHAQVLEDVDKHMQDNLGRVHGTNATLKKCSSTFQPAGTQ